MIGFLSFCYLVLFIAWTVGAACWYSDRKSEDGYTAFERTTTNGSRLWDSMFSAHPMVRFWRWCDRPVATDKPWPNNKHCVIPEPAHGGPCNGFPRDTCLVWNDAANRAIPFGLHA